MRKEPAARQKNDGDVQGALIALIGALVVTLLIIANAQLAGLGQGGSAGPSRVAEPALPPPLQGTSNDVISEELRQLSRNLASPLNLLRGELDALSGLSSGQADVANSFQKFAKSVRNLGTVQGELAAMSAGLGDVVGNTEAMAGSLGGTNAALSSVDHNIRSTSRATNGMLQATRHLNASVVTSGRSTNETMAKVSSGIEAMRGSLTAMNQSLSSTSAETKKMTESVAKLSANMERFFSLFCILLTSEPNCETTEASTASQDLVP